MDNNINILATRNITQALIDAAVIRGFHIDCMPFIATAPVAEAAIAQQIRDYAQQRLTTIFTSVQAVNATFRYITVVPDWTAFAIAGATSTCLSRYLGVDAILGAAIDARRLAPMILAQKHIDNIVFFCGNRRSSVIPDALSRQQIRLEELVVYTTTETPQVLNKRYDAYLFFSPSAVQSFFKLHKIPVNSPAVAIGASTADCLRQFGVATVLTADFPDQEHVLDTLYSFFEQ